MKRYIVVIEENGEYKDISLFGERQKDIKGVAGFVAIKSENTVNHPTPEILARALLDNGVDVVKFYGDCENIREALEAREAELIANGDEKALKRQAKREEAKIALEAKKAKANKQSKKGNK